MLGLVLWMTAVIGLLAMGAYTMRHPERKLLGMSLGTTPPPQKMHLVGVVLVSLGLIALVFEAWMIWMFVAS